MIEAINIKLFPTDEENLLSIWDSFTDLIIDDKYDPSNSELKEFLENTIVELASGNEVILKGINQSVEQLFTAFFTSFKVDGNKFYFQYKNIIAEGLITDSTRH